MLEESTGVGTVTIKTSAAESAGVSEVRVKILELARSEGEEICSLTSTPDNS